MRQFGNLPKKTANLACRVPKKILYTAIARIDYELMILGCQSEMLGRVFRFVLFVKILNFSVIKKIKFGFI